MQLYLSIFQNSAFTVSLRSPHRLLTFITHVEAMHTELELWLGLRRSRVRSKDFTSEERGGGSVEEHLHSMQKVQVSFPASPSVKIR